MAKKSKLMKVVNWVINILMVVSFIIMVYFILWRIFGNSPTDFQFISSILGFMGMVFLKIFGFTYNINREVGELKIGVKGGFRMIKKDIGRIDNRLDKVGEDIHEIKKLVNKR